MALESFLARFSVALRFEGRETLLERPAGKSAPGTFKLRESIPMRSDPFSLFEITAGTPSLVPTVHWAVSKLKNCPNRRPPNRHSDNGHYLSSICLSINQRPLLSQPKNFEQLNTLNKTRIKVWLD